MTQTATPIGARARRFTLELPLQSPDGFGGVVTSYVAGPLLWGAIEFVGGGERRRAGRPEQAITHRVRLRFRDGVTAAMRLALGPRRFAIRLAADPDGARRELICLVEEILGVSTSPILALRAAIRALAAVDVELAALFGGTLRLDDEPPRAAVPVYALFGDVTAADWSTDFDRGHEQDATILVFGAEGSARDALLVAERFCILLSGAEFALSGHRLVNLRVVETRAAKDDATGFSKISLRLRAVTEVL